MTTNQEKAKIVLQLNYTRQDLIKLLDVSRDKGYAIFRDVYSKVLKKLREEDKSFNMFDKKFIPSNLAMPYLEKYGLDRKTVLENAKIEKECGLDNEKC